MRTADGRQPTAEKGRVFLDLIKRPYLLRQWGKSLWLFYWHPEGHWTSLREAKPGEIFPDNLTKAEQDCYHRQHQKWEESLPI